MTMPPEHACYRGVAHLWECDSLGHLNSPFYSRIFDDASTGAMLHFGFSMVDAIAAGTFSGSTFSGGGGGAPVAAGKSMVRRRCATPAASRSVRWTFLTTRAGQSVCRCRG